MEDRIRYPEIDEFIRKTIAREEGIFKELEEYAAINHIPIIPPETAALLRIMVKIQRPARILEVGTAIGYSALIMAAASKGKFHIDTIEILEETASLAERNIQRSGFGSNIRVLRGDAFEILQCLTTPYDMIFLDASKGQYPEYLPECLRLIREGGVILSDNVLYRGLVAQKGHVDHKHRTIAVRLGEYLDSLCKNPLLDTAIIPIGDGLAVSYRRGD
ncbi:MAG: O-methyltransferase [Clostridiaceae bacterium]|nr:O-methyltransferase [Bacillota bacterium]NLI39369.1 O-methyltransferase [Clostridiaceae bacterium]